MYGNTQSEMHCGDFEALMADAIDGLLDSGRLAAFEAHRAACPTCGPMYADAQAGLKWLQSLEEIEPPAHLVNRILAATTGVVETEPRGWAPRLREWFAPALRPAWHTLAQPRFAMSFGMAFFSITMLLSVAGVKVSDVRQLDLRPSAVRKTAVSTYYTTSARVVRYYENLRWVYEIETRVRDLRQAATPAEPETPPAKPQKQTDDNTSGEPDRRQNENYSQETGEIVLAKADPKELLWVPFRRES